MHVRVVIDRYGMKESGHGVFSSSRNDPRNVQEEVSSSFMMNEHQQHRQQKDESEQYNVTMANPVCEPTYVYIRDEEHGWIPAILQSESSSSDKSEMTRNISSPSRDTSNVKTKQKCDSNGKSNAKVWRKTRNKPKPKSTKTTETLLQCVDDNGNLVTVDDLRDLPYLHEASILYNLKERYERQNKIYTRAHDRVLIAINPYQWIEGMYAEETRILYAEHFVWNKRQHRHHRQRHDRKRVADRSLTRATLQPHLYEVSSLAMRELQTENKDQTIIVSGESGSGKTTASKIIMSHLATFHELKKAYVAQIPETILDNEDQCENEEEEVKKEIVDKVVRHYFDVVRAAMDKLASYLRIYPQALSQMKEKEHLANAHTDKIKQDFVIEAPDEVQLVEEEPEEMRQTNLIVQRVLDANPLLEAFGNAKTQSNDNSSRFSKHNKLQFHVHSDTCNTNIAGSVCDTFLLEKSRVVGRCTTRSDASGVTKERTFHIFYQLMEASDEDKLKIWDGLVGKEASSFRYIGQQNDGADSYSNESAFKNTIAALSLIGIVGDDLGAMLRSLCAVIQLGNITFEVDPHNPDGSIVSESSQVDALSHLLGVESSCISQALTFKTVSAVHDTYKVPLNTIAAKATCDAFAKEIYSVLFEWLVQRTNDATCATKNYMFASENTTYRHIAALDLFGFESHDENGFEQLLINHANERLQKSFTDTFINSILEQYDQEGITVHGVEHERNDAILKLLEGKVGFMALLNEECIRPQGCDAGFVNKVYATLRSSPSGTRTPLIKKKHYDLSPTNTLFGIQHFAGAVDYDAVGFVDKNRDTLADDIISMASISTNMIVSLVSQSYQKMGSRKGSLVGTSLWTKFGKQMKSLFAQMEETRTTYVRCILPNSEKKPMSIDSKCTINQLRSVGILTAIKMSHTYPEKQNHTDILERFWPVMYQRKGYKQLWKKYSSNKCVPNGHGDEGNDVLMEDCETLLASTTVLNCKRHEDVRDDDPSLTDTERALFAVGKTRVYFRSGGVEMLEKELAKTRNRCASIIQGTVRGFLVRVRTRRTAVEQQENKNGYRYMPTFKHAIFALPRHICQVLLRIFRPPPPMISQ